LYREISPDLIISGHWAPRVVSDAYLEALREEGEHVARLHRELLPLEAFNLGAGGFGARIQPYRSTVERSGAGEVEVIVTNPLASTAQISGNLVMPSGWKCDPTNRRFSVEGHGSKVITFVVYPSPSVAVRRARIAIDLTLNGQRWGQQAEALIDVL
jgi:hypothetical protein